jgi:hypothetical protein
LNPMVNWTPVSFGRNEGGGFNLPWGGSKYNDKKLTPGSKYHMENWTRGQNIIGKLTPGSIYHGVQNTMTPVHYFCFCFLYIYIVISTRTLSITWNQTNPKSDASTYYLKFIKSTTLGDPLFQQMGTPLKKYPNSSISTFDLM